MASEAEAAVTFLATPRLFARHFRRDDLEWFVALHADVEVMRYLGGVKDRNAATDIFTNRVLDYYEAHPGLGVWMTLERSTGEPIGFHLLNHIQGETIVQVGYTLARSSWGKGYATEMAREVLRYGFADLKLPRISGMASLANVASQRVLAKIGLRRDGERAFPHHAYASEGPMAWFEREADDWLCDNQAR